MGVEAYQRVDQHIGDDTLTVYDADSGDFVGPEIRLIEPRGNNYGRGYTGVKAGWIINAFTVSPLDADSLAGVEGAVDTAIVRLYAKTQFKSELLWQDSCASLPCTLSADYNYFWEEADSIGNESRQHGLINDFLYFEVHAADSAGGADTMETRIQWFINLVEE